MQIISVDKLCKEFNGHRVIDNISFSVTKGEMIAIVGESGKGKTTLLNIIGLISDYSSGDVKIYDKKNIDINSKDAMMLRRNKIGYLFQNYGLVEDETVNWNLNIVLEYKKLSKKERNKRIDSALKMLNLETLKNKEVYKLSGGEQQRIAMLKLYLQECELILADEPTGSLDEKNRNLIIDMLKEFNAQGKTIIMVTHDKYVANCCERIIKL